MLDSVHQIYLIISRDTYKERATSKVIPLFKIVWLPDNPYAERSLVHAQIW